MRRLLDTPDVWLASLGEIARWWTAREQVTITTHDDGGLRLTNLGAEAVVGLQCIVEREGVFTEHAVPALAPGASIGLPASATIAMMGRTGGG